MDDAITIKPINTKQLFRCNFTQFANSNVAFHRPHQHLDSGPTTLPTHPNFTLYNNQTPNCQLNDRLNKSNKLKNSTQQIPLPPPLPNNLNNNLLNNQNGPSSFLINNTYTIKRELRNNQFLANGNETNSLNFISGNSIDQNLKLKKKLNLDKSNCAIKTNSIIDQFDSNLPTTNLNSLNNFNNSNLNSNQQQQTNFYSHELDDDNHEANNSLPDFQSYSINQIETQPNHSNTFFSLPYQQVNNYQPQQYNQEETCVKRFPHQSFTVDRQNFNQINSNRNCVNNHCTPNHIYSKKISSSPFLINNNTSNQVNVDEFNQSDNLNHFNTSIEDLRNEASSKQVNDERTLQPNLISALRQSISTEKQRLYKEQLRNELALKLKMKNHIQSSNLTNYLYRKKPKYEFLSQLYFLFHISFTLCLFKVSEIDKENQRIYGEILNFFFGYLLATAIMFLLVLRCCKNPNLNNTKEFRSRNTSIVSFGCISLGLIQLVTIGLDVVNCMNSDLLFLPILQFAFAFLLMHFILTQTKESNKYFYNNVAISHLLLTVLSIWLGHFNLKQKGSNCGYFQVIDSNNNEPIHVPKLYLKESSLINEKLLLLNDTLTDDSKQMSTILINSTNTINGQLINKFIHLNNSNPIESTLQLATVAAIQFATNASSTFSDLLMPIIHHFQILTVFILISIWLNNNRTKVNHHRTRLCETESVNCFNGMNDNEFSNSNTFLNTSTKLKSIKGFFLGLLAISTTIVVLTTGNDYFLIATHSTIQMICVVVTLFALFVRGKRRKGLQKLPQKLFINLEEFHLFVIASLICAYYCSFSAIILNLTQKIMIFENLIDSFLLTIQITLQTILLRSDGRKLDRLRDVHAFLIFANFSLYILEITEIATINGMNYNLFNLNVLPQIIVSLNRFYSSLICIHFWKAK